MWNAALPLFAVALVLSAVLTATVRLLARRMGFLDEPEGRKAHVRPVPYGGGVAIFLAAVVPIAVAAVCVHVMQRNGRPSWMPVALYESIRIHLGGAAAKLPQLAAVLAGGLVMCVLGLIDDRRRLSPCLKLVVQLLVASGVAAAGVRVTVFLNSEILGAALTVLWIVGLTNAFNFIDNMDGLSAGVAFIISVIFFAVAMMSGQFFIAAALAPFAGALLGFLPFNLHPARIFMGDAGSLFVGYFLAVLSVLFTFYSGPVASFRPFVLPLIIFAVPVYDAVSVTIIRLREGRSPFSGDRRHLSHRLVALGLSERLAVGAIHLLTLGIGLSATALYLVEGRTVEIVTLSQTAVLLALVVVLERAIRRGR